MLLVWGLSFAVSIAAVGGWLLHVEPRDTSSLGSALVPSTAAKIQGNGDVAVAWTLSSPLPVGWTAEPGVGLSDAAGGGLAVRTTPGKAAYQLVGPRTRLSAGDYAAWVTGALGTGGIQLGILDGERDEWIVTQTGKQLPGGSLSVGFRLGSAREVVPILANFAPVDAVSRWTIRSVTIARPPDERKPG